MSMTLILWKGPVVREADEAEALLKPFYDSQDESAFEASPDIAAAADELKRLYPWRWLSNEETVARMSDDERRQWKPEALKELRGVDGGEPFADLPWHQSDRLLVLDIIWSAENEVIDAIERIARERGLVLYDPQGPDVHLPDDPTEEEPDEPTTAWQWVKLVGMPVILVGLTYAAWQIPIGWIRWPAVIVLGFVASAALFVLWLCAGSALGLVKERD